MSTLALLIRQREGTLDAGEIAKLDAWIQEERERQQLAKESALQKLIAAGYAASDPSVQYRAEVIAGIRT